MKKIGLTFLGGLLLVALASPAAFAADGSAVSNQVLSALSRDLGTGGSLTSRSSFGLFETGEDYLYRVDTLAFTRSLRPTRQLSKPSEDDGYKHGLFSQLSNMKRDNTFEYGGSHESQKGVFVGSIGYTKFKNENTVDQDQNGTAAWDWQSEGNGDTTQLYLSYGGRIDDNRGWGIALNYLDSDLGSRSSSVSGGSTTTGRSIDQVRGWRLAGAYADNSSDSFGWSIGGWVGDESSDRMNFSTNSFYDQEFSNGYDISGNNYGIVGRATWYNDGSDHEISLVYGTGSGNVDNPIVTSQRTGTSLWQRRMTGDNIDTDVTALTYRAIKRLGSKVDLSYGLGYTMAEISTKTFVTVESGLVGNLSPSQTERDAYSASSDTLTLPFAVRLWITNNFTLTIGAQLSQTKSEFKDGQEFFYAVTDAPDWATFNRNSFTSTGTAASISAEYFFGDHLQLQLALLEQQDDRAGADAFGMDEISFSANFSF